MNLRLFRLFSARTVGTLAAVALPLASASASAEVSSWDLTTAIIDLSGNKPLVNGQSLETVTNPLSVTQHVFLPDPPSHIHVANTFYDASWLVADSMGHFDVTFNQQINGRHSFAISSGNIYLTTDEDLFLNLAGTITFQSTPGTQAEFTASMVVVNQDTQQTLWNDGAGGGDGIFGYPASGSGSFARSNLHLPAGSTYLIQYLARTLSVSDITPHTPLSATGSLHFDWRPVVPEPSNLALLVAGALRFGPRRSRARPRIEKLLGHDR